MATALELYGAIRARVGYGPTVRAIIELHKPTGYAGRWCCKGCDSGLNAENYADTPCSTLKLIAERLGVRVEG